MAIRQIRVDEDPILRKKCRTVDQIDEKVKILVEDMLETMYQAEGVGLAAPQIGILKRIVVIDTEEEDGSLVLINPKIISREGEVTDYEACLSLPDKCEKVTRPEVVVVEATDIEGNLYQKSCSDLLARAVCHELDHLDGILFIDRVAE
jgi:peptide deformylase